MKIKSVNAVNINFPRPTIKSKPWRDSWNKYAPRILPINKYPQFSKIPSIIPGLGRIYCGRFFDGLISAYWISLLAGFSYDQYKKNNDPFFCFYRISY